MMVDGQSDIDLLGDVDPDVRIRAALALGTAGADGADGAAAELVHRLGLEPSHNVRETLTWAVLRMAPAARPHLFDALSCDRWQARMQACHVLSKLGDPADARAVIAVIDDPVDAVAARAWWAAGQTRSAEVVPALLAQLGRGDAELGNSLSIAVAELAALAVPGLVAALRTGADNAVRTHAADTLALIGAPAADPAALALAEALDDPQQPDAGLRLAALNALAGLRAPVVGDAVGTAVADADPRIAALAQRLLPRVRRAALRRGASGPPRSDDESDSPGCGIVEAGPGVLIEVTCRSAYVADGRTIRVLGRRLADLAATMPGCGRTELLAAPFGQAGPGTVADALEALSARTGERIGLGAVAQLPGGTASLVRHGRTGAPTVGVLVAMSGPAALVEVFGPKIAHQVAWCAPRYLAVGDVPDSEWAAVRTRARADALGQGRPEAMVERIVAGRQATFATENVLLEQVSITDPEVTVDGLLYGRGVHVTGFVRLAVGERSARERSARERSARERSGPR